MEFAIETFGLGKTYQKIVAVRNLNIQVPHGEIFALLGPNGAGKTTTINMLLGNIRPTMGKANLLGNPIGDVQTRRRIGFLPEKFQFHDFLNSTEFLRFHGKLSGLRDATLRSRIPEILEKVGLSENTHTRIREFSRGMQQRIGLAQAILHKPELVILDEPTSALDPIGRRDVRDIVHDLKASGTTVILNSHLLSEIEMTCDRIAIIYKGEMTVQGTLKELLSFSSMVQFEVEGMNDAAMRAVRQIVAKLKIDRVPITHFTVWLHREEAIPDLAHALVTNGVKLKAMVPIRETLEEMFVRIIEAQENSE